MADYSSPPPSQEIIDEREKIEKVKRAKQIDSMREMGFSIEQAKGLLEMGVSPKVSVKTEYRERIEGDKHSKMELLHSDEEEWLIHKYD